MSLITRCPACGTMFKVVSDQLKVSQGWVRCGQCADVFDASLHLLPAEAALLPASISAADGATPHIAAQPEALQQALPTSAEPEWAPAAPEPDDAAQGGAEDFDPAAWKRAQDERLQNGREALDGGAPALDMPSVDRPPSQSELMRREAVEDEPGLDSADEAEPEESPDVSFVRDARRKAFWRKPWVRGSLAVLSLGLLAVLLMQWALQQKDNLAALEPRLTPLLQALCGQLQCEIRPPRHIESLVIDGSSFNRIGPDAYSLSFTLKNTGAIALAMPSLEVTLTDSQDRAVLRRVLLPAQFGADTATLAARAELTGAVSMKVSAEGNRALAPSSSPSSSEPFAPLPVAGYRILAFYP